MIVAAVDRSDRAQSVLREAATLADQFDESLHVVHVMERSEFVARQRDNSEREGKPVDIETIRQIAADHSSELADQAGIDRDFTPVGLVGEQAGEVCNYARSSDAQYIVLGTRKRSPAGKAVFGSVAQSIILDAPCAVVSIPEES